MDLSKLPRMSNTPAESDKRPADAADPAGVPLDAVPAAPGRESAGAVYEQHGVRRVPVEVGVGAEAWVSGLVGLVFLYFGQRFGGWLLATLTGRAYNTGYVWPPSDPRAGQVVPYWSIDPHIFSPLSDCALFVFGLALLLEAAVLLQVGRGGGGQRAVVAAAIGVTGLATLLNLATIVYFMQQGFGLALMSVLAVAFGGYMCAYLARTWRLLGGTAV